MQRCPRCQQDHPLDAYPPSSRGRPGTYCRDCRRAIYRERRPAIPPRPCQVCGQTYQPVRNFHRFCSPACKMSKMRERERQGVKAPSPPPPLPALSRAGQIHQAVCVRCRADFTFEWKRRARLVCDVCRSKRPNSRPADYGMTTAESRAFRRDATRCAICRKSKSAGELRKDWHVDHCHATGKLREVLCSRCNLTLGLMDDDPERLESAAAYIRRHSAS